ncbi:MAG: alpha/beta fold hydrolase [Panacagrimonas sp.]
MPRGDAAASGKGAGDSHEGGSGTPLVLLHGLGGTWHIWKPVLRLLEQHHRVLALTLPGHFGGPALPAGVEPTVDALADVLVADLRSRGIERAHLAGNSLGGWLALELARRGMAQSVTALSPAGAWRTPQDYQMISRPFRIVFALLPLLMILSWLFLRFAAVRRFLNKQAMNYGDRVPHSDFFGSMRSMRKTTMLPRLLTSMGMIGAIKPMQIPENVPVRIAWCEHDKVIPFETYGKPMLEAMVGAEMIIVKGVGHVPMYDDPEQVADIILAVTSKAEALPA